MKKHAMLGLLCLSLNLHSIAQVVNDIDMTVSEIFDANISILDSLEESGDTNRYQWFGKRWQRWQHQNTDMLGDLSKTPREHLAMRNKNNGISTTIDIGLTEGFSRSTPNLCPDVWDEIGAFGPPLIYAQNNEPVPMGGRGNGRIDFVKYDATNNLLFACSPGGGLFYRNMNDVHWKTTGFDKIKTTGASYLVTSPFNSDIWFVATGGSDRRDKYKPSDGVYRTLDGGATWESMYLVVNQPSKPLRTNYQWSGTILYIQKILMHPSNQDILYAATTWGIYKTVNATESIPEWNLVLRNEGIDSKHERFYDIEFKPGDPSVIMASGDYAWISNDDGEVGSWFTIGDIQSIVDAIPCGEHKIGLAVTPANPNRLIMMAAQRDPQDVTLCSEKAKFYTFNTVTNKWDYLGERSSVDTFVHTLTISQVDETKMLFGTMGGSNIHVWTINYGDLSKQIKSSNVGHLDTRFIVSDLTNGDEDFYVGNDGGLLKFENIDSPSNYQDLTEDLAAVTAYVVGDSEFDKNAILYGAQDNHGNLKITGTDWMVGSFGDGNGALGDKHDPDLFYLTNYPNSNNQLMKITHDGSGGFTRENIYPGQSSPLYDKFAFSIEQNNFKDHLYYAANGLGRKTSEFNNGNWQVIYDDESWGFGSPAPSPVNKDILFVVLWKKIPNSGAIFRVMKSKNITAENPDFEEVDLSAFNTNNELTWIAIEADDINENGFWLANPGYFNKPKVAYYDGIILHDISGNLPDDVSVKKVVKQPGPSNIIYVATTQGVFKSRNNTGIWEEMCGIPYAMVNDLEINQCAQKLRAATFGRGIWEADLESEDILEVNIGADVYIPTDPPREINVKAGSVAIVTGQVNMPIGGKIVIERGGKLIINGGTITCNCGFWEGIQVEGDKSQPSYHPTQGEVQVINGGTIKHAKIAISTSKKTNDIIQWDYTGGVIKADNANFIDNWRDIEMLTYHDSNRPYLNRTNFKNTTFKRTNHYELLYKDVSHFVHLENVAGIEFSNCHFIGKESDLPNDSEIGIYSNGSHFNVSGICDQYDATNAIASCVEWERSSFENITTGIMATNIAPTSFVPSIAYANFINCYEGIRLEGLINASVHDNQFVLHAPRKGWEKPYGVYLRGCTGYGVYDNTFEGNNFTDFGVIVNNSAPDPNLINRNDFNGLALGMLIEGENRDPSTGAGLINQCNNFSLRRYNKTLDEQGVNNGYDIALVPVGSANPSVANYWGDRDAESYPELANNYFSDNCFTADDTHITSVNLQHKLKYVVSFDQNNTPYLPVCYNASSLDIDPKSITRSTGFNYDVDCANFYDNVTTSTLREVQQTYKDLLARAPGENKLNKSEAIVNELAIIKKAYKLQLDHYLRQKLHPRDNEFIDDQNIKSTLLEFGRDFESYRWVILANSMDDVAITDSSILPFIDLYKGAIQNGYWNTSSLSSYCGDVSSFYTPFAEAISNNHFDEVIQYPAINSKGRMSREEPNTQGKVLEVAPNPSLGLFNLNFNRDLLKKGVLVVYDMQGRALIDYTLRDEVSALNLNLEGYPKGIYMLKLIGNDHEIIELHKLLLQ
ncbi:MAG: hypothetical protein ACI8ZO_000023 [Flavobacteriales bacterium]|jgi:hypothetical protein